MTAPRSADYVDPDDGASCPQEVVSGHDLYAVPCGTYRQIGRRPVEALGVRFTVPFCWCGADQADHEASDE